MYFGAHNHTMYSNVSTSLDCINKLSDLVVRAQELGMTGLAITNHDNLCEIMDINELQKKLQKDNKDFVLAIGNEIYLVDAFDPENKERQDYFHFILIAKDKIGFDAIVELSTRAWYRAAHQNRRRRIPTLKSDIEEIMKTAKGHLVATSACIGGELAKRLLDDDKQGAGNFIRWCKKMFGEDDFYIELQPSNIEEQIKFNKEVVEVFSDNKFIVATDAHYQDEKDFPIFEAFLRSEREDREVKEYYEYARLMSTDEVREVLKKHCDFGDDFITELFTNTNEISAKIKFFDLAQNPKIPKVPTEGKSWTGSSVAAYPVISELLQSGDSRTTACLVTCLEQLVARDLWNEEYLNRLEHECDVFNYQGQEMGDNFFAYFVTMRHLLDLAWSIDCAVGPSRGSASGSLLCYLMDIVQCDPIQHGLKFWRFAHKYRTSPLDVDYDIQPSKRPQYFEAIRAERGELGLTQVATFKKLTLKAAIGNAGRGYRSKEWKNGLDADVTTYLSSLIEIKRGFVPTLEQTLNGDADRGFKKNHSFIKEAQQYPGLLEIIEKIEGIVTNSSTHAAAIILFDEEDKLTNHCSLMRSPNGDMCTALDLYSVEKAGCYKYDALLLSTLDTMSTTFKLLQQDKVINPELSLKECYREYLDPNKVDFNNPKIWETINNNEVLSVFQWGTAVGKRALSIAQPQNLDELSALNGLIRMMAPEGEEDLIERSVRIKNDPQAFENELTQNNVPQWAKDKIHAELDVYNGVCMMQESFMTLVQDLAGYTLGEADGLRKVIAKKKMKEVQTATEFFFDKAKEKGLEQSVAEYLFGLIIRPSLGYGFNLCHSKPYSIIGVQCALLGKVLFHPIYWQTAYLLQSSGALDGKATDYNKIAKAVALIKNQGVDIQPININKSAEEFTHDVEENKIYYGYSALKGVRAKAIIEVLENRPYDSFTDFIERTKIDVTSLVALIKADAFKELEDRNDCIEQAAESRAELKIKLNGQNLLQVSREGLWPEELDESRRIFNFTQYLKKISKSNKEFYLLDEKAIAFLDEIEFEHDGEAIERAAWKSLYDGYMIEIKQYLKDNQEELLDELNGKLLRNWRENYFNSELGEAFWEIETMGICFEEFPFAGIFDQALFSELPVNPVVKTKITNKNGRVFPIYELTTLVGIVIAKDKMHDIVTLLTVDGPVDIKLNKESFGHYDAQVSQQIGGKKKVIEKSWFTRGTPLMVQGMRRDDNFVLKKYKASKMQHTIHKILNFTDSEITGVQFERRQGIQEETLDHESE